MQYRNKRPFKGFEDAYKSLQKGSLHDILIKFAIPKTLVRLIQIYLDGTESKVRIQERDL